MQLATGHVLLASNQEKLLLMRVNVLGIGRAVLCSLVRSCYESNYIPLLICKQLGNLQHATSFASNQAQDTNSTSRADDVASHDVSSKYSTPLFAQ